MYNVTKTESGAETVVSKASTKRLNYIKNRKNFKIVFERNAAHLDCKEDQSSLDQFKDTLK